MFYCKSIGCTHQRDTDQDFCPSCQQRMLADRRGDTPPSMAEKYPKYYKSVADLTEIDVYKLHQLFDIQDPSGAIQHASKKLLLSGARTGGKSMEVDIREARDTLTRWLEMNQEA